MALQTLLNSKKVLPKPQGIYNPFLNGIYTNVSKKYSYYDLNDNI